MSPSAGPALRVTPQAPPFLVLRGTRDALVPRGERLAAALRAAGVPADHAPVAGTDQLRAGLTDEEVERCFATTAGFVARRCPGA
ncbi:hypothetical protein AB0F30_33100 [Streptomyces sp. NPDC029006]|uniref:hypothetical protein n=1 Tax=Streptomyces sp. NPDC029006 TaxID=3155467 RepID=UPI0033D8FF2A